MLQRHTGEQPQIADGRTIKHLQGIQYFRTHNQVHPVLSKRHSVGYLRARVHQVRYTKASLLEASTHRKESSGEMGRRSKCRSATGGTRS